MHTIEYFAEGRKYELQKYTEAQEAVLAARQMAEEANNNQIEPAHLLMSLVEQPEGVVPQVLARLGVDMGTLAQRLRGELDKLPKVYGREGKFTCRVR